MNACDFLSIGSLSPVEGDCPEHGKRTVLTRSGIDWHCPECMELRKAAEFAAQWSSERNATLHAIADLPARYKGQRFTAIEPAQKAARFMAASFRNCIIAKPTWATLILVGKVGTGKTLLACEFAESYITKFSRSVRYITAKGMISEIQASYGKEGKSEDSEIERFVQYDLLIVDEIDAIPSRDNAALLLTEIINRRYGNNKPMIVITNQSLDSLAQFVGDRVLDRLHENSFISLFDWQSFRRQG